MLRIISDDTKSVQTLDCAFANCPLPAKFCVKQKQGNANVCKIHYEELTRKEALASCKALGIDDAEQARAYLLKMMPRLGRAATGTTWARRILERHAAGENIGFLQLQMAREALPPQRERQPGDDDEVTA